MENRIDGVVVLVFVLCLKVSCHATLMALVEIHYYLCDDPIDVSSEKKKKKEKAGLLHSKGKCPLTFTSCGNLEDFKCFM